MSPGSTTTLSHLDGSACSVPSARLSSFVERAPGRLLDDAFHALLREGSAAVVRHWPSTAEIS